MGKEAEEKKVDVKRVWKAKCRCQMPWRDFEANETVELLDSEVTPRVKALFDCLTPEEAKALDDSKKVDPELKVMIERLKAAKIPVKRGATKEEIKKLFDEFLANSTAGEVAEAVK